jgi:hypothetical protein
MLIFAAFAWAFPTTLLGCPKKPEPAVEEAPPPPPAATPSVLVLAPLTEDAGNELEVEAGKAEKKRATAPAGNANQLKIQACCNAMRAKTKELGNPPELIGSLSALAAQCDVFAKQVGPGGSAPEFNQLRQLLRSLSLPAACAF